METEVLNAAAQNLDFSFLALFWRATLTVKVVMFLLMVASFWSWAIIIQKHINFAKRATPRVSLIGPSGRGSRWTSSMIRLAPIRARPLRRYFRPACWNGGARIRLMAA